MTCFIQNLCKWLFICPSILFYWILLDDSKLQISFPLQGWAKTTGFFLRQGVSFKWRWNKTTIVDQKIGGDSDIELVFELGFCLFFRYLLFDCSICFLGSIYRLDRVLKFLHTKLNLNIFIIWISRKSDIFPSNQNEYKEPKSNH